MPRTPAPFCTHSNSTTSPWGLLSQDDRRGPPPETCPRATRRRGPGRGRPGGRAEGLLEEAQLPAGPEGQAQLDELVELEPAPSGRPGVCTAARSALPSPSSEPPGPPPVALPEGPQRVPPCPGRVGQGYALGPGAADRRPSPGRQGDGHSHGQAHPRAVFLTLTLPPSTHRAPSGVYQNKRPNSPRAQAKTGLPRQAGLQARPPQSHVTLLFREARECALFWVPRALMLPDAPHPGSELPQVPKSCPEGDQWTYCAVTAPSTHPQANGPRAARGLGSETSRLQTQPCSPTSQTGASTGLLSIGTGAGQPWAAGAAVDKFLGPDPYLGLVPALPCPHGEAWQLGDSRAGKSKDPGPPHPRQ